MTGICGAGSVSHRAAEPGLPSGDGSKAITSKRKFEQRASETPNEASLGGTEHHGLGASRRAEVFPF